MMEHWIKNDFTRLMEVLSEEIVGMGLDWRLRCADTDAVNDPTWATLDLRLEFVEMMLPHCNLSTTSLTPSREPGKVEPMLWRYVLLYDASVARGLVKMRKPMMDYEIDKAFHDGCFIGWEAMFFDTKTEALHYMRHHPEYERYSLYYRFERISMEEELQ